MKIEIAKFERAMRTVGNEWESSISASKHEGLEMYVRVGPDRLDLEIAGEVIRTIPWNKVDWATPTPVSAKTTTELLREADTAIKEDRENREAQLAESAPLKIAVGREEMIPAPKPAPKRKKERRSKKPRG